MSTADNRLLYPSHEHVDAVWARVAKSVDHDPLSKAGATGAKVATTENPEQSHVICVYYDNVYDKEQTEKVSSPSAMPSRQ